VVAGREDLLEAAERVVRRDGPDATLDAMAAGAGVTKPILYRHIGDKAALVDAIAERLVDRINSAVAATAEPADDPPTAWRRFLEAYLGVVDRDPQLFLFASAAAAPDPGHRLLRLADRSAQPMAAQLGGGPAALTRAYAVIGMLHVVTLWWLRDRALTRDALIGHLLAVLSSPDPVPADLGGLPT
jgi:AcrR family transcriptional regulator